MEKIPKETIDLIISEKFDANFWLFELGRSETVISDSPTIDHQFMNSFFDKGEKIWNEQKVKLKTFLCNQEKCEPKEFAQDLTQEGIIEIINLIIEHLTHNHNIALAIAIPLCGLALNKGLFVFCSCP